MLSDKRRDLRQQGAFTNSRLPRHQHHAAWQKAAAEHRVKIGDAGCQPCLLGLGGRLAEPERGEHFALAAATRYRRRARINR